MTKSNIIFRHSKMVVGINNVNPRSCMFFSLQLDVTPWNVCCNYYVLFYCKNGECEGRGWTRLNMAVASSACVGAGSCGVPDWARPGEGPLCLPNNSANLYCFPQAWSRKVG